MGTAYFSQRKCTRARFVHRNPVLLQHETKKAVQINVKSYGDEKNKKIEKYFAECKIRASNPRTFAA
jgi:hypothetical protein